MNNDTPRTLRLWTFGCCHVGTDLREGRESLADAIRQSEHGGEEGGPAFEWDLALGLGDFSGTRGAPDDNEGRELTRQFAALEKHRREDVYCLVGNHDANVLGEPCQWWFRKWVDPTGEHPEFSGVHTERRPCALSGTWERYEFRVGNIVFLMMGDRNDGDRPAGRGAEGGYPAGAVTGETFAWWKRKVEENPDSIIVSAHHHMLKDTTVASGPWEGFEKDEEGGWRERYHGYFPDGAPEGASYLYFVDGRPDAQAFEGYLADHPGAVDLWLGGHTHTNPDDTYGGKTHVEEKWGVHFANVAGLTRYHGRRNSLPLSRLFTFEDGSTSVRVQCYLHTSEYAPQGWYEPAERTITIGKPFRLS